MSADNGTARLRPVDLPEFGMPGSMPVIPEHLYIERMDRFRMRFTELGYDRVVVYADREHSANLSYLTGFDPRFEEALLIVGGEGKPTILVGNECVAMAEAAPLEMNVRLFQDFSLPGQPRDRSPLLTEALADEGIGPGRRVGAVGWKTFSDARMLDIPSYIADEIRSAAGGANVDNATGILIDAGDGMRVHNELEQLAYFEWAACQTSSGVHRLILGLEPGLTEHEAVSLLGWNGTPLSCHLMLTAGERARLGLLSPGDRRIERGDPLTVAFGIWGALNCRAGFVVYGDHELPENIGDYVERLVAPYFETVAEWYRALHVGQRGAVLHEIVDRRLGDPFFGIFLNPGHQIHLDEWVNTPVGPGSEVELRSGMALQVDIIPATGTPYFTTNIEDGIVLADATLRERFAAGYPDAWTRIQRRREFMRDSLGIDLHPDVLPLSNMPAHLTPYLLDPGKAMSLL
ncbi:MAG TPA: aminopeptidase P family N-terminal domain-containing protein [Acidimicrobiia bacterium]|nr:aminopeptidase P family N-terminal domain-containing protein [Acidimicrobiia bacterium]